MLLGTSGASLLENLVTGKGTIRAVDSTVRAHSLANLKYKSIIKMNLNLMMFIKYFT